MLYKLYILAAYMKTRVSDNTEKKKICIVYSGSSSLDTKLNIVKAVAGLSGSTQIFPSAIFYHYDHNPLAQHRSCNAVGGNMCSAALSDFFDKSTEHRKRHHYNLGPLQQRWNSWDRVPPLWGACAGG